ncbi:hypothetical protein IWX90DRAFT_417384 [Phyllosticta citrichinensis]|uniref:Uncharacterized protein n=1 Tax=Phyllosticta citrichinensis TaxID=1130410 RepID=A0ABR1XKS7_9PEZI
MALFGSSHHINLLRNCPRLFIQVNSSSQDSPSSSAPLSEYSAMNVTYGPKNCVDYVRVARGIRQTPESSPFIPQIPGQTKKKSLRPNEVVMIAIRHKLGQQAENKRDELNKSIRKGTRDANLHVSRRRARAGAVSSSDPGKQDSQGTSSSSSAQETITRNHARSHAISAPAAAMTSSADQVKEKGTNRRAFRPRHYNPDYATRASGWVD